MSLVTEKTDLNLLIYLSLLSLFAAACSVKFLINANRYKKFTYWCAEGERNMEEARRFEKINIHFRITGKDLN